MGANHLSTRADKAALEAYRDECAHVVNEDGTVGARCWICGQDIDYEADPTDYRNPSRFQRDHVKPASTHPELVADPGNWAPSHAGCNIRRSNKAPRPPLGDLSQRFT